MLSVHHCRKYSLNELFFSTWSSDMAYVLGFWFADGYMRHDRSYRVVFTSADKDHLESIRKSFQYSAPLTTFTRKEVKENCVHLILYSQQLFNQLSALGGIKNKSLTMTFPYIPNEYFADFLRGYFDGDGSVFFAKYHRTKDRKLQIDLRSNFTSGNPEVLMNLSQKLNKILELPKINVCRYGTGNQYKLGYSTQDTKTLLKFMYYPNCRLYLQRKANYLQYC